MSLCSCGHSQRSVTCFDCFNAPITCVQCFVQGHQHQPLHWAQRWNTTLQFYERMDMCKLDPTFQLNLGHSGDPCPSGDGKSGIESMKIVDVNGIHVTRVRFCQCRGPPNRMEQLLVHQLFPGTPTSPRTAFSFAVMRHFQMLQLEAKISAHHFCTSLRRLTSNIAEDVKVPFTPVMQVWRVAVAIIRHGQAHGIDEEFPNRIPGNKVVHCPLCPEPHCNVHGDDWRDLPDELRHLNQLQLTTDGNHQANRYMKNTDPLSRSLYNGSAYFPEHNEYQDYLKRVNGVAAEKTTCTFLNAAEKQDRKKFKNMDITGIVNIQCSHVFIKSSVDLQLGERYLMPFDSIGPLDRSSSLPTLSSLPQSLSSHVTSRDVLLSYDIACGYNCNLIPRFQEYIPDMVDAVFGTRFVIPAVHIQNHQESCMYQYSAAYTPSGTHFHGETAEQPWYPLNGLSTSTRQMSNGHRQDCIIDSHNDWNWKKTAQIHSTLKADLLRAREVYLQHRLHFQALTKLHCDKVAKWDLMDRSKRTIKGKEVECVYRRSGKIIPSQQAMVESLSQLDVKEGSPSKNPLVAFINEGIYIQRDQHDLRNKYLDLESHSSNALQSEVNEATSKLRERIDKWRTTQGSLCPLVCNLATQQIIKNPIIYAERLFLPSDFSSTIQQFVKAECVIWSQKQIHLRGQDQNTRALAQINRIKNKKASLITLYNSNRASMIALGLPQDSWSFPTMTEEDTWRVSVDTKRSLGASRQFDGAIWSTFGRSSSTKRPSTSAATVSPTPKKTPSLDTSKAPDEVGTKVTNIGDGWIWRLGSIGNMTAAEIQVWEEEGDRVHWFRAEAEMERWREQWELKLAEFIRCIAHFQRMADAWSNLALRSASEAHRVYARKRGAQFQRMADRVKEVFRSSEVQDEEPTSSIDGESVANFIIRHQLNEWRREGGTSESYVYVRKVPKSGQCHLPDFILAPVFIVYALHRVVRLLFN
ncbi:hypothetical protein BJ165DRAFT_1358497 [Panaeolus papilionaceus]|nr:hypothetical protein BJ165DRAFT_1358497 [Panaeolus papilionaceus]